MPRMNCNVDAVLLRTALALGAAFVIAMVVAPIQTAGAIGLIYVDADNGENFSPNLSPSTAISTPVSNDNLWGLRGDAGAAAPGSAVFQSVYEASGGTTAENVPEIRQTIDELTPNTPYDVYVAYWQGAEQGHNWNVRAGLSSGNLTLFNAKGPNATFPTAVAGTAAFHHDWEDFSAPTDPPSQKALVVEEGRKMLLGRVGSITSSPAGEINVFLDDLPTTIGGPDAGTSAGRTWFDGLAYAPAGTDVFIAPGDFNDDNSIDPSDAHIFLINIHTDVSALSMLQTYRLGDLNADLLINHADFVALKGNIDVITNPLDALTLRVTTAGPSAGKMELRNNSSATHDVDYYELISSAGALNSAGWTSLDDQESDDPETVGWDEVPASNANLFSEINLQSMTTMSPGASLSLGQGFNPAATRDVQFYYGLADGSLARGIVEYLAGTLTGDYNGNSMVDAADYVVWRKTLNQIVPSGSGADGDRNGIVDQADYNLWRANFGKTLGASASLTRSTTVPEPTGFALTLIGILALAGRSTPRGRNRAVGD